MKELLIPTMQEYPFTTLLQKFGPDPLSKLDGDNSPNLAELARSLGLRIDGRDPLLVGDRWVGWPTQTDTEREEKTLELNSMRSPQETDQDRAGSRYIQIQYRRRETVRKH